MDNDASGKATAMMFNGSIWEFVGNAGFTPDMAEAMSSDIYNGTLYVAYRDHAGEDMKISAMMYNGSSWENVGTPKFSVGNVDYVSLSISSSGIPYVAFRDTGNENKATVMKYDE